MVTWNSPSSATGSRSLAALAMLILPTLLALAVLPETRPRLLADPPLPPEIEDVAVLALPPILLPRDMAGNKTGGG